MGKRPVASCSHPVGHTGAVGEQPEPEAERALACCTATSSLLLTSGRQTAPHELAADCTGDTLCCQCPAPWLV